MMPSVRLIPSSSQSPDFLSFPHTRESVGVRNEVADQVPIGTGVLPPARVDQGVDLLGPLLGLAEEGDAVEVGDGHEPGLDDLLVVANLEAGPPLAALELLHDVLLALHHVVGAEADGVEHDAVVGNVLARRPRLVADGPPQQRLHVEGVGVVAPADGVEGLLLGLVVPVRRRLRRRASAAVGEA